MNSVTPFSTAISAFVATNLDDLVLLVLLFAQANLRQRQIVTGQYLGFGLLVLASLPGFLGGLVLPPAWIGLLGLVPLILGLNRLLEPDVSPDAEPEEPIPVVDPSALYITSFLSPQAYGVALLTVANGSDNIAIYLPLFAHCSWITLILTLGIFFTLVGLWCYAACRLTRLPILANLLRQSGDRVVPYLLIGLGIMILWDSQTLVDRGLTVIALLIGIGYLVNVSQRLRLTEVEET